MHWITLVVLSSVILVYLLVGAAVFMALERDNETEVANSAYSTFTTFIADNTCVSSANLSSFVKAVLSAYDAGVIATSETSTESNWSYEASLLFSVTIITSIGYGHISPTTSGGQVFFIFYAIIGIPLCATMLAGLGEKLAKPYKKLEEKQFFKDYPKAEKLIKLILFNAVCFVIFSLVPAAIFMAIEGWTYLQSWYYTIVTLSTVGFGDYVPGQQSSDNRAIYKILTLLWIFCGLAWLATVLSIAGDFVKSYTTKVDANIEKTEKKSTVDKKTQEDAKSTELQERQA